MAYLKSIQKNKLILSIIAFFVLTFSILGFVEQSSDLSIEFDYPKTAKPGNSFVLKAKIHKKDIRNFSRLQIEVPEGINVQLMDGKNGTFSFIDQEIKLIWLSLPNEDEFEVLFRVFLDEDMKEGIQKFNGKISYLIANKKNEKTFSFKLNLKKDAKNSDFTEDEDPSLTNTASDLQVKCTRELEKINLKPRESTTVKVKINKGNLAGMGKLIESIPPGYEAEEINNSGAVFNFNNNQVKFLWTALPAEDSFEVTYKLTAKVASNPQHLIEGYFSYQENDDTKQYMLPASFLIPRTEQKNKAEEEENVQEKATDAVAENDEILEEVNEKAEDEAAVVEDKSIAQKADPVEKKAKVNDDPLAQKEKTESNKTEEKKDPTKEAINYRVQICATKKPASTDYFVKNNNVTEKIYVNMHEGWHKFTVGGFDIYKKARNHREKVKIENKIKGPFVTAYNQGNRITVQEALMITKQEWVP